MTDSEGIATLLGRGTPSGLWYTWAGRVYQAAARDRPGSSSDHLALRYTLARGRVVPTRQPADRCARRHPSGRGTSSPPTGGKRRSRCVSRWVLRQFIQVNTPLSQVIHRFIPTCGQLLPLFSSGSRTRTRNIFKETYSVLQNLCILWLGERILRLVPGILRAPI